MALHGDDLVCHEAQFLRVVRGEKNQAAFVRLPLADALDNPLAQRLVQSLERLVHQEERRGESEGTSDGDPLLLAVAEFRRAMAFQSREFHLLEQFLGDPDRRGAVEKRGQRKGDVLESRKVGEQERLLGDKGDGCRRIRMNRASGGAQRAAQKA